MEIHKTNKESTTADIRKYKISQLKVTLKKEKITDLEKEDKWRKKSYNKTN